MQDDVRFSKIVKRITKLNIKYFKAYNTMIFNICDNNLDTSKLDDNLKKLNYKLDYNCMLLAKISKEYKRLSIDEIKLNLLYFVNNSQATKETKAYNKKFLNYLFRK
jgi:hypothetical protein